MSLLNQITETVVLLIKSFVTPEKLEEILPNSKKIASVIYQEKMVCQLRDFLMNSSFQELFTQRNKVFRTLLELKRNNHDEIDQILEIVLKKFIPTLGVYAENKEMISDPVGYFDNVLGAEDLDGGIERKENIAYHLDMLAYLTSS